MALGLCLAAVVAPPAAASSGFSFSRIRGIDRYATAAGVAVAGFPSGAGTAILATGDDFPDALAGAFLAGSYGAPILLTEPSAMPPATAQALTALNVHRVVVLGGTLAVSADQVSALSREGYQVARIAGQSRYDTMAAIAEQPGTSVGTDAQGRPTAILATGTTFPDALAAGALSGARRLPILLTPGTSRLGTQAAAALVQLHIGHVLIVGGTAAVSASVAAQVQGMGIATTRLAGHDRSATAAAVAQREVSSWGLSSSGFVVARGDAFPDALGGAALAVALEEPLLLTASPLDPGSALTYASDHGSGLSGAAAVGGVCALAGTTLDALAVAAGGPLGPPSPLCGPYASGIPPSLAADFASLRRCESSGDYRADTGNGYYGAYQFSAATWRDVGYAGLPDEASPGVQDQAAYRLYLVDGWAPWPTCGAALGGP
ncbi:MAG: cell wall-binding repeat-containing protein [Acidimicrobiales bacterium]